MAETQPYGSAAQLYTAAGWPAVLPVPPETKTPPPAGFTGEHGRDPGPGEYALWTASMPHWSVALRMPDGVIGIDVDDYAKGGTQKRGAATLAHFEQLYGPLPATWSSTARGDGSGPGASRIMFFRCPPGRYRSMLGPDVEIIQRHHRYAVVAPSWHHDVDAPYRWYTPRGERWNHQTMTMVHGEAFPTIDALSWLPERWVQGLREGAAVAGALPAPEQAGHQMLAAIQAEPDGVPACAEVYSARLKSLAVLAKADPGSRHDLTIQRVHALVMLGAKGHPGAGAALAELAQLWERLTAGEDRGGEFERMMLTSARKAVTEVGRAAPVAADPCLIMFKQTVPGGLSSPSQAMVPPAQAGIFPGGGTFPTLSTPPLPIVGVPPLNLPPGPPATWGTGISEQAAGARNGHANPGRVGLSTTPPPVADPATAAPGVPPWGMPLPPTGMPALGQGTYPDQPPAGAAPPAGPAGGPSPGEVAGQTGSLAAQLPAAGEFNLVAAIGTAAFDPPTLLDQPIADAVLERLAPVLRYALDAKTWLVHEGERWDAREDLIRWGVGFLARFAPAGDPGAEKGTPEAQRAARRVRLLSTAGRNSIAAAARDVVSGGSHPASLRLSQLDTEPEVLWAGGVPFDLSRSQDALSVAELDPGTPHLHSAGYLPGDVPTPLWDTFLAAMWPDPEIRAWALRVLSVSLTGYADATMPVMVGLRDRGKTAVVQLILDVLGTYGIAANAKLLSPNDTSHDTIVYALKGARMAFIDEGPRNGALARERLKQLTGGGRLSGREVGQGEVRFEPTHTLVLTANEPPELTDEAIRKRARLIPCEGDVDAIRVARRAIGYVGGPRWRAEAPGVLAQLMREAARWLADRDTALTEAAPASIRHRADEIAAEQDPVRSWVEDECEPSETATLSNQLYRNFVTWWRDSGRSGAPASVVKWGRDLTNLGYPSWVVRHGNQTPKVRGLRLRGSGPGGGWGFVPPAVPGPGPVSGWSGQPETPTGNTLNPNLSVSGLGSEQPETVSSTVGQPETLETPRSTPVSESVVSSVSSLNPIAATHSKNPVYTDVGSDYGIQPETGNTGNTEPAGAEAGEKPQVNPRVSSSAPVAGELRETGNAQVNLQVADVQPAEPAEPGEAAPARPAKAARTRLTAEQREQRAAQRKVAKAAEREAAQLAAIQAAQGPLVQLPAVVDRQTRSVVEVPVSRAAQIVAEEVATWGRLTLDVENTGYPIGHPAYALRTAQLGGAARAVVFDTDDPAQQDAVRALVAAAPYLEAHSAPADLVPLAHAGLGERDSMWDRMLDTVIPLKLADPQQTGSDPSLKAAAPAVLGPAALSPAADTDREAVFRAGKWLTDVEPSTPPERSGWAQIDKRSTAMVRYAASDVLDTAAIGHLAPQPSTALWDRERTAQRAVARIAHDGLRLNASRVRELTEQHNATCAELAPRIRDYGIDNPGSPPQVAAALAQLGATPTYTEKGKLSAAKGVLEPLRAAEGLVGDLARTVLDWRHADTALKLFLRPWQILIDYDPADPRVRSTVYTLSADTGRMSCVRFNLQQLSRQGGIRSCIEAWPGYVLVSADFQGVEVRTMAGLSQDPTLIRLITNGTSLCPELNRPISPAGRPHEVDRCGWCKGDLHRLIAAQTYGPSWTKEHRYNVKRGVFGWAYGGAVPSLARQIGVTEAEMQSIVDTLASIAPTYVDWADQVKAGVRRGVVHFPSYSGRVIHLDKRQPHKAPNYEIQGTARELLVDALIRWRRGPYGDCITVPVHDEILAMVPADKAEHATSVLVECMTNSLYGVPIEVEASKPCEYWQDAS